MIHQLTDKNVKVQTGLAVMVNDIRVDYMRLPNEMGYVFIVLVGPYGPTVTEADAAIEEVTNAMMSQSYDHGSEWRIKNRECALPGFVDSKNEEKTERNAGYLVVSHSGGGMLRQGTRKGIRRTPANRGMRAHRIVKSLDISEDVCHGLCP